MDPDILGLAGRVLLALVLGAVIGLEREVDGHPAGLRTHISVALGASLFGIISVDGFERFYAERAGTNVQVDVTRVASQVVVGIGFLGAGTIVKHRGSVRGLTTAASLWVVAAVGLAVGVEAFAPALLTTAALLVALLLRRPGDWVRAWFSRRRRSVTMRLAEDTDVAEVVTELHRMDGVEVHSFSVRVVDEGRVVDAALEASPGVDLATRLGELEDRVGITDLEIG